MVAHVLSLNTGTATVLNALTTPNGVSYVLAVDTTNKQLRLFDGTTLGGLTFLKSGDTGFTLGSTAVALGATVTTVTALTLSGGTLSGDTTLPVSGRIASTTGFIGIGGSPTAALDAINDSAAILQRAATTGGTSSIIAGANDYFSSFKSAGFYFYSSAVAGTLAGVAKAGAGQVNFINCSTAFIGASTAIPMIFYNSAAGTPTERFRIESGGTLLFTSKVGMGVTPTTQLHIGGNVSSTAWTTNGARIRLGNNTFTDTSSSGTVATAYTNAFTGSTIAASSATTFTNYFNSYFSDPTAGSNVTFTNKYALGADSAKIVSLTLGSALTVTTAGSSLADQIYDHDTASTAQLDKTSNTTLATVTGLSLALVASKTYNFAGWLSISSGAVGGLKMALVASGGLTATSIRAQALAFNGTTLVANTTVTALGSNLVANDAIITDVYIKGSIVVNVAGTVNVQAAQNTSDATTTSVFVGSCFSARRIN